MRGSLGTRALFGTGYWRKGFEINIWAINLSTLHTGFSLSLS